jgi:hypothetical protein
MVSLAAEVVITAEGPLVCSEDLGSVTKSERFELPVFQGGSSGIEMRGESGVDAVRLDE